MLFILQLLLWFQTVTPVLCSNCPVRVVVEAPTSPPPNRSKIIDHAHASLSIPVHQFLDYVGNVSSPNHFTYNLMKNLAAKTGKMPEIRLGGTSTDRTTLILSQEEPVKEIYAPGASTLVAPANVTLGPSFYKLFNNFPDVNYVYMVNLERNDSGAIHNSVAEAQYAVDALGERLLAIEIGNEPNFYPGSNRPITYRVDDYVIEWTAHAKAISEYVLRNNTKGLPAERFFQAFVGVSGSENYTYTAGDWRPVTALEHGLSESPYMDTFCVHKYGSAVREGGTLASLSLNASHTEHICADYAKDVAYLEEHNPDVNFIMGEGQLFNDAGYADLGNVLGYSLGTANYLLWSAAMNVTKNYMFTSSTHNYSISHPQADVLGPPKVLASYYGFTFWADFLGTESNVRVAQLPTDSKDRDYVRAYGAYHNDRLAKIAILNMVPYNATSSYPRPKTHFVVSLPASRSPIRVEQLTAPGADSQDGITWAGYQYTYESGGKAQSVENTTSYPMHRDDNDLVVPVYASTAVLLTL